MKTLVLSRRETDAWLHVRDVEEAGSVHSLTSCPTGTRAMCRFRREVLNVESKVERADRVLDADGFEIAVPGRTRPGAAGNERSRNARRGL